MVICFSIFITDGDIGVTFRIALESATEDVTYLTAIDLTVCSNDLSALLPCHKAMGCAAHARHSTGIATTIDVALYATAEELYVSLSTCVGHCTLTATIYIIGDDGTFTNSDERIVGIIICLPVGMFCIWVAVKKVFVIVNVIVIFVLIVVVYLTLFATAIYVGDFSSFQQVNIGKSRHGKFSQSCSIHRLKISIRIDYRNVNYDIGIFSHTRRVVTTIDTRLNAGICRAIGYVRYSYVAGASLLATESTTKEGVDLCGRGFRDVDVGYRCVSFGEGTAMHITHRTTQEVDGGTHKFLVNDFTCSTAVGTGTEDIHLIVFQAIVDVDYRRYVII